MRLNDLVKQKPNMLKTELRLKKRENCPDLDKPTRAKGDGEHPTNAIGETVQSLRPHVIHRWHDIEADKHYLASVDFETGETTIIGPYYQDLLDILVKNCEDDPMHNCYAVKGRRIQKIVRNPKLT